MIELTPKKRIILASSSLYRQQLLSRLQFSFEAIAPDCDETPLLNETPNATALRLAQLKAQAIAEQIDDKTAELIIIGSDQVATLEGMQIGKPGNHQNALKQLQLMRGKLVIFHTALCVHHVIPTQPTAQIECINVQTHVTFRNLPDAELDAYLLIEQPYDCAGSAKNEGLGIALLERIESTDPTSLTGLPLIALTTMLRNVGVRFFQ